MNLMDAEQVKEKLLKLHDCAESFSLVFSGKKSVRINGFYKYANKEICINNRNFDADEAGDNRLFYTAMHELAHHIQFTERREAVSRSHTKLFYAILDDLADRAEELGLYRYDANPEIKTLIEDATAISAEIAMLQRKLGAVLNSLQNACRKTGVRYEDVVKRKVILSPQADKKLKKITALRVPDDMGYEVQDAVAGARNDEQREAMITAAADGRSVAQIKQAGDATKPRKKAESEEEETETLLKEKAKIEKTIANLKKRLKNIVNRIKNLGGDG